MNKKLIALAVGATMGVAPMAASAAKVTVYGHAQVEIHNTDTTITDSVANGGGSTSDDANALSDNARGRFGIKASEKLGNGMTAIAKFEWRVDTADNARSGDGAYGSYTGKGDKGTTTGRESFVGLKGNFGTVQLGNLKSAYKYTGGVKYDTFTATVLEARNQGGLSGGDLGSKVYGHNGFLRNSIGYISPKINGFQGWITYSPDETGDPAGDDGDMSASLKYNNGPLEVFVKYVNNDDNDGPQVAAIPDTVGVPAAGGLPAVIPVTSGTDATGTNKGGDGYAFGGAYKFGNHKVMGQYESLSPDTDGATDFDVDYYFLAYHFKSGNNTFVGQLGNRDSDNPADGETDYYMVGMIHALSKKTRLTIGYSNSDKDNTQTKSGKEVETFAVGLRMIF